MLVYLFVFDECFFRGEAYFWDEIRHNDLVLVDLCNGVEQIEVVCISDDNFIRCLHLFGTH